MFGANPFGWPYPGQAYAGVATPAAATPTAVQGGSIIIPRRRLVTRLRQEGLEEDEAIALALLLRTRKHLR